MDATLVRQKVAQAVGWIIKKNSSGAMPLLGNIDTPETNDETSESKIQKILPGGVHYLEEDEDFTFASIDDIGSNLTIFLESQFRLIASALDVTYEQLTGDLSGVNFSSIRAGLIEFKRRVAVTQQLVFINMGLKPLTARFRELAAIYESAEMGKATCKYVLPKTEWVDPLKDAQADVLEIRAGLATLEEKLGERGIEDFDVHMAQLAKEQKLDIILDSNPVHNTQAKVDVTNTGTDVAPVDAPKKPASAAK
jgi:capsid protein